MTHLNSFWRQTKRVTTRHAGSLTINNLSWTSQSVGLKSVLTSVTHSTALIWAERLLKLMLYDHSSLSFPNRAITTVSQIRLHWILSFCRFVVSSTQLYFQWIKKLFVYYPFVDIFCSIELISYEPLWYCLANIFSWSQLDLRFRFVYLLIVMLAVTHYFL